MMFDLTLEDEPGDDSNRSSGIASSEYTSSAKTREDEFNANPFRFTPDAVRRSHSASVISTSGSEKSLHQHFAESPTSVQKSLCLNATSALNIEISDSDDDLSPATQRKLCLCASQNPKQTQEAGQRLRLDSQTHSFPYHTHQITEDYTVSSEIIGIGESGKVMACYRKKTNEKFALKVLRDGPKARREVDLHYLTNGHENVVSIIDIYENTFHDVKCLLMVCEFMEGGDLLTQFENQGSKPYSEKQVGEIIRQIGSAVMYLHDMNIAHRDIKLENILCSSTGEDCVYKLGDYGFAKRPERNVLMESPCCTPFYAPPEVLGRERYDKSCDMWSLGVAMYILLCGYPPFYSMKGLALSPGMRSRIAKGYYAFPHAEWDCVSQATKDDIRCLLRTNPSERMTIHELMNTPLVRGEDAPPTSAPLAIPGEDNEECVGDDIGMNMNMLCVVGGGSRRASETFSFMPDDHDEEDLMQHGDEVHDKIPDEIPKSVRFLRDGVKAPRLHSIQEEVGRALEMMRMGGDAVWVKAPSLAACSNPLLARRYKTAHMSISSVHCS